MVENARVVDEADARDQVLDLAELDPVTEVLDLEVLATEEQDLAAIVA